MARLGRVGQVLPGFYGLDVIFDVGVDTGFPDLEDQAVLFESRDLSKLWFQKGEDVNR